MFISFLLKTYINIGIMWILWIKMQETVGNLLKLLNGLVTSCHVTSHLYVTSHGVMLCHVLS